MKPPPNTNEQSKGIKRKRKDIQSQCNEPQKEADVLPIRLVKKELLRYIRRNETVIILGETGCGKTTQLPQYLFRSNLLNGGSVVVTQPRRIAAVSVAKRVAEEMGEQVGQTVGFKIRFQKNTGPRTVITFATDGILLREAIDDELLSNYNIVILDEAHERTVNTDILFGIVKTAQKIRKQRNLTPLKIIIMSAALDADHFKEYFNNAPVVFMDGRNFQIDTKHTVEDVEDYFITVLRTIFNVHQTAPANEDILVFMTGQEEIDKMVRNTRRIAKDRDCKGPPVNVYPLYAALDSKHHDEILRKSANGTRNIIISTNIAETSITIPGIKYVIDSGKVKMRFHNPVTGIDVLKVVTVSREQALQRSGRAGRVCDGVCFRIYSEKQWENMRQSTIPEINRCNLSSVSLTLLAMGKDPRTFDFLDKPDAALLDEAIQELQDLEAVLRHDPTTLTDIGKKMAHLPLDPKYAKMLLNAGKFESVSEILDIIAMLSTDNIFIYMDSPTEELLDIRNNYSSGEGDHITMMNILRLFRRAKNKKGWCRENYLNYRSLEFAQHIRKQLKSYCDMFKMTVSSSFDEESIEGSPDVRKCLIAGLFKNVAVRQSDKSYLTVLSKQRAKIHPSSAVRRTSPYCVIYSELVESNELYMKNVSRIEPEWLIQYIPEHIPNRDKYNIPQEFSS